MSTQNNNINIFAVTDSHQEARKLCCLFSSVIERAPQNGKNTLICDCGDLFKGIYDRDLCIQSYITLRQQLPEAKIVLALGNNDFGFNLEQLKFLQNAVSSFNKANIHVICSNLVDLNTGRCPSWVDPYILVEINHKKILLTAFCINKSWLQKYGLKLVDIPQAFLKLQDAIKHIEPDALIVLNHDLYPISAELADIAAQNDIAPDLIIGGHEHSRVQPDAQRRIYYPQAFSRTMLQFTLNFGKKGTTLNFVEEISCKGIPLHEAFKKPIDIYEEESGLNIPVAKSILHLERQYSDTCSLGTFLADGMKEAAKTDIGLLSTGYVTHALRYEADKILTYYNVERAFSAEVPLQTVAIHPAELKSVFQNAIKMRYVQLSDNVRFLQCSQNVTLVCSRGTDNYGYVRQIFLNGEPLLDENGIPLHPEDIITCAVDPFVGAGEQGFDVLRSVPKETLMQHNQLVKIKDIFLKSLQDAEKKYQPGSTYPQFKIIDMTES